MIIFRSCGNVHNNNNMMIPIMLYTSYSTQKGYGGGTGCLDNFYSFSFNANTWEQVNVHFNKKTGCCRNNGAVNGDASRMYLFGGYNSSLRLNDL